MPRRAPAPKIEEEDERRRLIMRLLEINNPRRQLFDGIWWSGGRALQIRRHAAAPIEPLGWAEVMDMIEKHDKQAAKERTKEKRATAPKRRR